MIPDFRLPGAVRRGRGKNRHGQELIHPGRFRYDTTGRIEHSHPIGRPPSALQGSQFLVHRLRAACRFQFGPNGHDFVQENGPVLGIGVPNDDPVEDAEPAKEKERGRRRKEKNQLGSDRARFSRL